MSGIVGEQVTIVRAGSIASEGHSMKNISLAGATLLALVTACPAIAADMPARGYKAPPPVVLDSWTGFYVGAALGWKEQRSKIGRAHV